MVSLPDQFHNSFSFIELEAGFDINIIFPMEHYPITKK